jgi:isoquinoline 1-oxidoreductase beta subunit
MTGHLSISRRKLIVGGLMVAFACRARARTATTEGTGPRAIGGFVRISQEGGISLVMPSVEMGQGIYTAESALLAEELDVVSIRSWRLPPRPTHRFTRSLSSRPR